MAAGSPTLMPFRNWAFWPFGVPRALKEFQEKRFDAAESSFRSVLEIKPEDGPAKFYLHQIEDMRRETLPADWKGEVELKDK